MSIQIDDFLASDLAGLTACGASRWGPPVSLIELKLISELTSLASLPSHHYISGESRGPCHGTLPAIL